MIILMIVLVLIIIRAAWRLDRKRRRPVVIYSWDGGWLQDGQRIKNPFQPDGLPSETAIKQPKTAINPVGEGRL